MSKTPRHPQAISGAMREQIEKILSQNADTDFTYYRSKRIEELLDELDEALMLNMLTQSLALIEQNGTGGRP
jgi:hypothetical protein